MLDDSFHIEFSNKESWSKGIASGWGWIWYNKENTLSLPPVHYCRFIDSLRGTLPISAPDHITWEASIHSYILTHIIIRDELQVSQLLAIPGGRKLISYTATTNAWATTRWENHTRFRVRQRWCSYVRKPTFDICVFVSWRLTDIPSLVWSTEFLQNQSTQSTSSVTCPSARTALRWNLGSRSLETGFRRNLRRAVSTSCLNSC